MIPRFAPRRYNDFAGYPGEMPPFRTEPFTFLRIALAVSVYLHKAL